MNKVDVEVRSLRDDERAAAGAVAARALADSPTSVWTYGTDVVSRLATNFDLFMRFLPTLPEPLGALLGPHVVGVCAASSPGTCIGSMVPTELQVEPEEIGPPGDPSRSQYVWSLYCKHDLEERHWHVGPVSVEPGLQGCGVGSLLLRAFGERMDADGEIAWLETDKPENVVFYRRHGFDAVHEVNHHGLTTWFMRRDPH